MTKTLDVSAWPQLAEVLSAIGEDEAIVLTQDGRVIAEVKPVEEGSTEKPKERILGLSRGAVTYIADDFDAELPDSFWMGEE